MTIVFAAAAAGFGFVFFVMRWMQLRRGYGALSQVERRRAEVTATRETARIGIRGRVSSAVERLGLGDNPFPLYAAACTTFLACAAGLSVALPTPVALLAAVPASFGVAWLAVGVAARRRRSDFNRQLVDLLDLTTAQIRAGVGPERALNIVAPQMPNPMREEMMRTLAAGAAGRDLVSAMRDLSHRYPSRAFEMFLSALEIDRAEGHAIAPALEQAATLLKQDFALAAEANAKLGQVKYEFYAVAAIISGIAFYLILAGGPDMRDAYTSPAGYLVIAIAVGNGALGFFRFFRKLNSLTGDTL